MVEHFLAKEDVASSSLVTRSPLHFQRLTGRIWSKTAKNTNKTLTTTPAPLSFARVFRAALCRALLAARQPLPGFFVHSFRQRLPFFALFFVRQGLPPSFRFPAEVAANGHNSAPFRFVVAATCGPRTTAGSARFADASLSQLPQKGSRRLFARFCASCRRHYQRAAAVSCRGGGRRPRYRLRFAPALRAEIQRGSSV